MQTFERLPGGTLLCQSDEYLKIGTDAVLLAEHAAPGNRICDLGCGCGAVLLRLSELRPNAELHGLELQPGAAALCDAGIALNGLGERVHVTTGDLRDRETLLALGAGRFDLVVSNPPYLRAGSGKQPASPIRAIEREDRTAPPEAVTSAAALLLKQGGSCDLILRQDRLTDYLCALRAAGIEPKRLLLFSAGDGLSPLVLVHSVKGGGPGLELLLR